ncbi:hydrolase TatD [Bacillus cereus]|uniref:Qat anti-phage system TatD family nuclease QatD n=1 Tax=Bacillus cereus TaxID=1396 RepID=UPI000BED904E|nr:Qat anti-phage system TatD family nuclease QatD [Bacillus cereus]PEC89407.1 hydrolase TatD [Bacillus cereus]PFO03468.1 hydrolase TatD [Bacillus cereus]PFO75289.1 hydrolase TatD [Bacillus cereus]PGN75024.1 hydrolase TatD [Bacillus cereus]
MNKFYYDTHMHLDLYNNVDEIIQYIEQNKSYTIAVTNLPILCERISKKYNNLKYIKFALGLHPQLINQYSEQIPYLWRMLEQCRYIGEVGLDFKHTNLEGKNLQIDVFVKLIKACHNYGGKILTVHSRGAVKEVNEIIGPNFNGKIILHWFSGSITELKNSIQNGYYFSINSEMIYSKKGRQIIKLIPVDKLLIESDAPFTRGLSNNYNLRFIDEIVTVLCELKGTEFTETYSILKNNFKKLLK